MLSPGNGAPTLRLYALGQELNFGSRNTLVLTILLCDALLVCLNVWSDPEQVVCLVAFLIDTSKHVHALLHYTRLTD